MEESKFAQGMISDEELTEVNGGAYVGPCIIYTIQRGDTLFNIAAKYGTTVDILVQLNNISNKNAVYAGHRILVPAR